MTLNFTETLNTYVSQQGQYRYQFTIVIDSANNIFVRDIYGPFGRVQNTSTDIPEEVALDIQRAIDQTKLNKDMISVVSGTLVFSSATSQTVTFSTPLSTNTYRVVFTFEDFILARVPAVTKTVTGFTVELNTTYTGNLGFDVLI